MSYFDKKLDDISLNFSDEMSSEKCSICCSDETCKKCEMCHENFCQICTPQFTKNIGDETICLLCKP